MPNFFACTNRWAKPQVEHLRSTAEQDSRLGYGQCPQRHMDVMQPIAGDFLHARGFWFSVAHGPPCTKEAMDILENFNK